MLACLVQMAETSASPACSFFDPSMDPLSTTLSTLEQERISLRTKGTKKDGAREGNVSDFLQGAERLFIKSFLFIIYNKRTAVEWDSEQPNSNQPYAPDRLPLTALPDTAPIGLRSMRAMRRTAYAWSALKRALEQVWAGHSKEPGPASPYCRR